MADESPPSERDDRGKSGRLSCHSLRLGPPVAGKLRWRLHSGSGGAFRHNGQRWRRTEEGWAEARETVDRLAELDAESNDLWEQAWRARYPGRKPPGGWRGRNPVVVTAELLPIHGSYPRASTLTPTERRGKVRRLLLEGRSWDHIAGRLDVNRSTVADDVKLLRSLGLID